MRKHKSTPYERIVQSFLLVFCILVTYYLVGCAAHLYFKRNYNHRTATIHTAQTIDSPYTPSPALSNLFAVIVSTNLVRVPCTCGYCRPSEGIAVPEHVNALGYDTVLQVSTNYLPIVRKL